MPAPPAPTIGLAVPPQPMMGPQPPIMMMPAPPMPPMRPPPLMSNFLSIVVYNEKRTLVINVLCTSKHSLVLVEVSSIKAKLQKQEQIDLFNTSLFEASSHVEYLLNHFCLCIGLSAVHTVCFCHYLFVHCCWQCC